MFSYKRWLPLAILPTMVWTPSASAQSGFAEFVEICVETEADSGRIIQAAERLGYTVVEGGFLGLPFDPVLKSSDGQRIVTVQDDRSNLEVDRGNVSSIPVRQTTCSLADSVTTQAELTNSANEWMNRPAPERNRHGNMEWHFELDAGRTPMPPGEGFDVSVLNRNPFAFLSLFETAAGNMPIVSVMVTAIAE